MKTITKKLLINQIARERGLDSKNVRIVIQELLDYLFMNLVEGNRFELRKFGVFEIVERKAKIGRNPKKPKEPITIPARKAVKFIPSTKMQKAVVSSTLDISWAPKA